MLIFNLLNVLFLAFITSKVAYLGVLAFHRGDGLNGMLTINIISYIPNNNKKVGLFRLRRGYFEGNSPRLVGSDSDSVYVDLDSNRERTTEITTNGMINGSEYTVGVDDKNIAEKGCQDLTLSDSMEMDKIKDGKEVLVFSDFTDLYKNLNYSNSSLKSSSYSSDDALGSSVGSRGSDTFCPVEYSDSVEHQVLNTITHSLARRKFVKKLFKKIPQIPETKLFLVRSKAYVKGRIGTKCDLSVFDSNRVSTKPILPVINKKGKHSKTHRSRSHVTDSLEVLDGPDRNPFDSISSVLPGVFTGLHTVKHTKKRIIRELKVKLDLYVKTLSSQLKKVIEFYKNLVKYIHPFQYNLFRTTIHDIYATGECKIPFDDLIDQLYEAKKRLVSRGKEINSQLNSTRDEANSITRCREAFDFVKVNIFQLDELYSSFQGIYDQYAEYYRALAKLPVVDIEKPIVAIIGHVNIGKTTLYNGISDLATGVNSSSTINGSNLEKNDTRISGSSEIGASLGLMWSNVKNVNKQRAKVADYNFTTRGINKCTLTYGLNNFIYEGQLIDTPGLLWRDGHTNFNPYERLTYSVLKDLPCGVLFCFDTSNSLDEQINLHKSLRSRFPHRPWLNVIVKGEEELKDLEDEVVKPGECYNRLNSMFTRLHEILKL